MSARSTTPARRSSKNSEGEMRPGDVYMINDPYAGGTHFNDVRIVRPIFVGDELIGFAQSNGHWTDVGGSVPGSFDVLAKEMFREGIRITAVKLYDRGQIPRRSGQHGRRQYPRSGLDHRRHEGAVGSDPSGGTRALAAWSGNTAEDTVVAGFAAVQDYVEHATTRQRIAALPDGTWESVDYVDRDPGAGEGLIPGQGQADHQGRRSHLRLLGKSWHDFDAVQFGLSAVPSRPSSPG